MSRRIHSPLLSTGLAVGLVVALVLALVVATGGRALAEEDPGFRLERLLPADSMAVITIPDVDAAKKVFGRTALSKIFRNEEVQGFLQPALDKLESRLARLEKSKGLELAKLTASLRGQIAIGLIDVDTSDGVPRPKLVVTIDARDEVDALRAFVKEGQAALRQTEPNAAVSTRKHGEVAITSIRSGAGGVEHAFVGSTLVLALHPEAMNTVLDARTAEKPKSLAASARWTASMKPVAGEGVPVLRGFINVARIFERFKDGLATAGIEAYLRETGVLGIEAVSFTSHLDGADFVDRIHLHAPGETRGLFKLVSPRRVTDDLLRRVPENAMYMAAGTMDLDAIWNEVFRVVKAAAPRAHAQVTRELSGLEEWLGLSLQEDIVQAVGGDMLLYATPPKGGGPIPEVVLDLALKDREKFEAAFEKGLTKLMESTRGDITLGSLEYREQTIRYARIDQEGIRVMPSYAFVGDRLVVGLFPNTVKGVIRRAAAEDEEETPSILDSKTFQAARAKMPRGASSLEYYDLATMFEIAYNVCMPFLQGLDSELPAYLPFSMAMLPGAEAISQHLTPIIGAGHTSESGLTTTISSPTGMMPVVAAIGAGGALLFTGAQGAPPMARVDVAPAKGAVSPRANKGHPDVRNLDEIGASLLIYYIGHDRTYPDDLAVLVTSEDLDPEALVSRVDEKDPVKIRGVAVSYEYIGPDLTHLHIRGGVDMSKIMMAWSRTSPRAVTFLSGSTRIVEKEEEFQKLLAYTRAHIAAAKEKAKEKEK